MPSARAVAYVAIFVCWPAVAQAQGPHALANQIDKILSGIPHSETVAGVAIVDLVDGKTVYERNADLPLIPASNMKIFVMATAFAVLGPSFEFETLVAGDGTNLVLVGSGDPALGDPKLSEERGESRMALFEGLAKAIAARGIEHFPGDLLIDESIFDDERINPTWEASDLGKWYAAPVGALNFNDNCVDITLRPAKGIGEPALVSFQPASARISITNNAKSGGGGTPVLHHPPGSLEYVISGRCAKEWQFGSVSFPDPGLLTADALLWALQQRGIRVAGDIKRIRIRGPEGGIPQNFAVLGRIRTPLGDVMQRIGKNSQNLFAECLMKRAAYDWARKKGIPSPQGSWKLGAQAIMDTLIMAGIDVRGMSVADGSGLSRENRCTARQLTSVLAWANGQPFGPMFRNSLSSAGTDGSLRKRLADLPGFVLGKTGTMRGIRTLSGFVAPSNGRTYAFAIMFNSYKGPSTPYKAIQDQICRTLAKSATAEAAANSSR